MGASEDRTPSNGPSRALLEADPDESVSEILKRVTRYECSECGESRFTRPQHCKECGCEDFDVVEPEVDDERV